MSALDAWWHLINAVSMPLAVALLSTAAVRLLWPAVTRHRSVVGLAVSASIGGLLAHGASWWALGAEGTILGHVSVVSAVAVVLWVKLFMRGDRR